MGLIFSFVVGIHMDMKSDPISFLIKNGFQIRIYFHLLNYLRLRSERNHFKTLLIFHSQNSFLSSVNIYREMFSPHQFSGGQLTWKISTWKALK